MIENLCGIASSPDEGLQSEEWSFSAKVVDGETSHSSTSEMDDLQFFRDETADAYFMSNESFAGNTSHQGTVGEMPDSASTSVFSTVDAQETSDFAEHEKVEGASSAARRVNGAEAQLAPCSHSLRLRKESYKDPRLLDWVRNKLIAYNQQEPTDVHVRKGNLCFTELQDKLQIDGFHLDKCAYISDSSAVIPADAQKSREQKNTRKAKTEDKEFSLNPESVNYHIKLPPCEIERVKKLVQHSYTAMPDDVIAYLKLSWSGSTSAVEKKPDFVVWSFFALSPEVLSKIYGKKPPFQLERKQLGPCMCIPLPQSEGDENEDEVPMPKRKQQEVSLEDIADSLAQLCIDRFGFLCESKATGRDTYDAGRADLKQEINRQLSELISSLEKSKDRWPDYVFEDDFCLPTLNSIVEFARQNKHLEGIVSEDRIKAGDFNAKREVGSVLKYVEMLALHLNTHGEQIGQTTDRLTEIEQSLLDFVRRHQPERREDVCETQLSMLPQIAGNGSRFEKAALQMRQHQISAFLKCLEQNTIVSLPTGSGKSLIAVKLIDEYNIRYPRKNMILVVPTRILVEQQAAYIRQHAATSLNVGELCGQSMDIWQKKNWMECLNSDRVLVGTPEVFRCSFVDKNFIEPSQFSLIMFDECHNAVGKSPMAAIMYGAISKARLEEQPRIVGLTASFVNGSLKDIVKKRKDLEALLQSVMFSPEIQQEAQREFTKVDYPQPQSCEALESSVFQFLSELVAPISRLTTICDEKKVARDAIHVLIEAGKSALFFYIEKGLLPQLEAKAEELELMPEEGLRRKGQRFKQEFASIRKIISACAKEIRHHPALENEPCTSGKAEQLVKLLTSLYQKNRESKGIVFVKQIALTFPLAHLCIQTGFSAGVIVGCGSMTDNDRSRTFENFRIGNIRLLVCTNAVEEGIDISDCDFVIRFSRIETTKNHIQGSGRARASNAKIYYFDNNPDEECAGATLLNSVAKDPTLGLDPISRANRAASAAAAAAKYQHIYPYQPEGTALVDLLNCLNILLRYSVKVLWESVSLDDLCTCSGVTERSLVVEMRFPSPSGMVPIKRKEVDTFWGQISVSDVLDADRRKGMTQRDLDLRRFTYVVIVSMRENGFLTPENEPTAIALAEARFNCPVFSHENGVRICPRFSGESLLVDDQPPKQPEEETQHRASARTSTTGPPIDSELKATQTIATPCTGHQNMGGMANMEVRDPKSALNLLAQTKWRKNDAISYRVDGAGPFIATLSIEGQCVTFRGNGQSKKSAEKAAALQALHFLQQT